MRSASRSKLLRASPFSIRGRSANTLRRNTSDVSRPCSFVRRSRYRLTTGASPGSNAVRRSSCSRSGVSRVVVVFAIPKSSASGMPAAGSAVDDDDSSGRCTAQAVADRYAEAGVAAEASGDDEVHVLGVELAKGVIKVGRDGRQVALAAEL